LLTLLGSRDRESESVLGCENLTQEEEKPCSLHIRKKQFPLLRWKLNYLTPHLTKMLLLSKFSMRTIETILILADAVPITTIREYFTWYG